jgi:tRNA/tmRNA/rRNA uracil-C5-methylase (TrmA/RlmC/RlmD family)
LSNQSCARNSSNGTNAANRCELVLTAPPRRGIASPFVVKLVQTSGCR